MVFMMFLGQLLQIEFWLLISISYILYFVGWEELLVCWQDVIDKVVVILQECYQYMVNWCGMDMMEFVLLVLVMFVGEDVLVCGLIGKLVWIKLMQKGLMMFEDLLCFLVCQWLEFLIELMLQCVWMFYEGMCEKVLVLSCVSGQDDGVVCMVGNYVAIVIVWLLLCEFVGMDLKVGGFFEDFKGVMNGYIEEILVDCELWVWIIEVLLYELVRGQYWLLFCYDEIDGDIYLLVWISEVMYYLFISQNLKDIWNGLLVKSDCVYKDQLECVGVLCLDLVIEWLKLFEWICGGCCVVYMVVLFVFKFKEFGLYVVIVVDVNGNFQEDY